MPQNPACFATNSSTATAAVQLVPDDPEKWLSRCNCTGPDGQPTVTCIGGTYDEAARALTEHRGEPDPDPSNSN